MIFREDDWEIDRRFVLIDYDKRLGQGAFGSVHEGTSLNLANKKAIAYEKSERAWRLIQKKN